MFSDKFRQYSSHAYAGRMDYIARNSADKIAARAGDMRTALEYLYGTLPHDDVRFTPFEWMEEACAAALETRAANQYGVDIPENIFVQYVLCPRVNNERAQIPGGRKTVKSKNGENLVFSRSGVAKVTPFPFSSVHSEG